MLKVHNKLTYRVVALFLLVICIVGLTFSVYASMGSGTVDIQDISGHASSGLQVTYSWSDPDGQDYDNSADGSFASVNVENDSIVCKASGYYFDSTTTGATTLTVTLKNNSDVEKTLGFTLTKGTICNSVTVDGTEQADTSKVYSIELVSGESCIIVLTTAAEKNTNTITLSDLTLAGAGEVTVTFQNPSDGSGTTTLAGQVLTVTEDNVTGLNASPADGYRFIGWKTTDGNILSYDTATFPKPDVSVTVYPYFVPSDAPTFTVDNGRYYYWEDAFDAAQASASKLVVLYADGILSNDPAKNVLGEHVTKDASGNVAYTIPSGCKLLIPYSASDGGSFGSLDNTGTNAAASPDSAPTTYRTLTLAADAQIICEGELNVNGQRDEAGQTYTGGPAGAHGKLVLQGTGTQLTVDGTLFCYGFIYGTGHVVVNGTIHELLQLCDFAGGTNSANWNRISAKQEPEVFLLTQYYVQNVEAPLRVNATAIEIIESAIKVSSNVYSNPTTFIGSDGLFQLSDGAYIERTYDSLTDRTEYVIGGGSVTFGKISVSMTVLSIKYPISSDEHVLPVNSLMTIRIKDGASVTMGNAMAILPGGKVIVEEGCSANLSNSLFIFDKADWLDAYTYSSGLLKAPFYTVGRGTKSPASSTTFSESGRLEINGTLNIASNGALYTTSSGGNSDKVIYGTGTINHGGKTGNKTLYVGYTTSGKYIPTSFKYSTATVTSYANLAGLGTMQNFSTGTYYGLIGDDGINYWYKNSEVVAPTCTEAGYTKYWCDDSTKYIAVKGLSAAGHSFTKYEWDESKSAYVAYCDNGCGETDERELCISLASMTMANSLNMNFAIEKISTESLPEGCYVKIRKTYADGREDVTQTIDFKDWKSTTIDGKAYYYVTFTGIAAKEMTDTIYATIYNSENTAVSAEWKDSVQAQAMRNLEKTNVTDKSKTMVVDMLNYGAAAQNKFGYATDNLATSKLTDAQKACATESVEFENTSSVDGCTYKANVSLKSNIRFLMAFKDVECSYAVIIFTNHRGTEKKITIQAEDFTANNSYSVITIEDTVVADGRQEITCKLYNEQDEVVATITDSIESYAARAASNNDEVLYKMLMKYSDSAYAYFHPGEGEE